jgi:hypothetical protein
MGMTATAVSEHGFFPALLPIETRTFLRSLPHLTCNHSQSLSYLPQASRREIARGFTNTSLLARKPKSRQNSQDDSLMLFRWSINIHYRSKGCLSKVLRYPDPGLTPIFIAPARESQYFR